MTAALMSSAMVVFMTTLCCAQVAKPKVDERISTEVLLADMAFREINGRVAPSEADNVRTKFRDRILVPLNATANGKLQRRQFVKALAACIVGEEPYLSLQAAMALGRVGDKTDTVVADAMLTALNDERPYVRGNAASVLNHIHNRKAVEPLVRLLNDKGAAVVANAASALGELGETEAVAPLIALLNTLKPAKSCDFNPSYANYVVPRMPYMWMIDKELEEQYRRSGNKPDYAAASFSFPLAEMLSGKGKDLCSYVRWHAADALRKITGKRFGEEGDLWRIWWQQNGAKPKVN